jgi:Carboxypeptidase regulatory-like domain/TonB dependent receptor
MTRSAQLVTALFFPFAFAAFGQTGGTITGVISDPAGAVVPAAPIEAKNAATGVVSEAATSATGNYTLGDLPAGTYELDVTVPGFKKYVQAGITVQQLQTTRVDVVLEVGVTTESIVVQGESPLLSTESGDISHNVTTNQVDALPVGSIGAIRDPRTATLLIPGVTGGGVTGPSTSLTSIVINGTPAASQQIRIDGLDATYSLGNTYFEFAQPNVDSIEEVAVQTSNYAAEFGQSAGSFINFTMKSGTNQFHGSAYDYWVNEALNASGSYSHTDPKVRKNDYGGTVGGPVWIPRVYNGKDRTFFFFSFESLPTTTENTSNLLTVPTAQYREGNFSAAEAATNYNVLGTDPLGRPIIQNTIYDPDTQRVVNGLLIRDPFPNNVIPMSRLDPVALKIQSLIPQPQGPDASQLINNYNEPYEVHAKEHIPSIKIDHSLSSRTKLSFFFGETFIATPGPPTNISEDGFPTLLSDLLPTNWPTYSYRLNYDQTITPTVLFHLGGGYVKSSLSMPSAVTGYNVTTQLGLTGPFTPLAFPIIGTPAVPLGPSSLLGANNTGGSSILGASGFGGAVDTYEEKTNFVASLNWVKSNHSYKFGGETRIEGYPNTNFINTNGSFGFSAAETGLPYLNATGPAGTNGSIGLPYASFLLGLVDNYNVAEPAVAKLGKHSLGFYAQDNWKVTRKFTLNYGLRWDFATYQKEQYGRFGDFSPTVPNTQDDGRLGGVIYGATCNCQFAHNYPYGFGPRLGFAYQLDSKTVLRGGAAIIVDGTADNNVLTRSITSVNQVYSTAWAQAPMTLAGGVPLTYAQIAYPNFSASHYPVVAIPGTPGAPPTYYVDPNGGRPARMYQWSIGVQREIVRDLAVEASYVGDRGIWWQSTAASSAVNYNANTPQSLLADGLDITTASARAILAAPIGSPAAGPFMDQLPYSNFPLTATVAQSLRPFPQFSTAPGGLWAPLGDSWYNSLQARVMKRLSHGLDASLNFTWSKSLTNGIEGQENNVFDRGQNTYLSEYDRPFVTNINVSYTVPAPRWANSKILKYVLSDWQIGALATYASGALIQVPNAVNLLSTELFQTSSYMDRVPGVPLFLQNLNCHCFDPTKTLVLNAAAWADAAPGTWGTSPAYYDDYRAERHPVENFSAGRTFRIREQMNLTIRAEFINIFNRTVLPAPSSTTPLTPATCFVSGNTGPAGACQPGATIASGFGFIQTADIAGTPRQGQLVARFRF